MVKGSLQNTEPRGAAGPLRDKIHELEIGLAKLKRLNADEVAGLLKLRDEIARDVTALTEQGVELRPELTRIESVDGTLTSKADTLIRKGLAASRRAENPPKEHWWWYLDSYVAERRRKWLIRTGITIAGIVVVVLIANWVMDKFFGMSPTEKQAYAHTSRADQYMMDGDVAAAIAEYEQALVYTPEDGETLAVLGVLYETQGQQDKADEMMDRAEQAFEKPEEYLITAAQAYRMMRDVDKALEVANAAVETQPKSAYAHYVRGIIYQDMERIPEALEDMNTASSLANEQGQTELFVLARQQYGMLLQRGSGF